MNLEWIDDLLAVIDSGSLSIAAQRRFITQPAFSRRIRALEKSMGVLLIDRARKPVQAQPALIALEPRLREASQLLHELKRDLSSSNSEHGELVLVGQHAISTTFAPLLVKAVSENSNSRIRLRSANREDCLSLLLTRQVDIALLYQLNDEQSTPREQFLDTHLLGEEMLVPVVAANKLDRFKQAFKSGAMNIIAYPRSVFLGDVLHRKLLPSLSGKVNIQWTTEAALTSAALQLALTGNGIAWIPLTLANSAIDRGELARLDKQLPAQVMSIVALKLVQQDKPLVTTAWNHICAQESAHHNEMITNQ